MNTSVSRTGYLGWLLCGLLLTCQVHAEGITIEHASGRVKENVYLVDAQIEYDLSDSVLEAIAHGIQLHFEVTLELHRGRKLLWDDVIKTVTLDYVLQFQPLSNNYLVTNLSNGDVETLQELDEALQYLGTLNNFPLTESTLFAPGADYRCYMMSELKISTLPLPLQPLAYLSPKWHLTSQWYEWTIR